ncbi:hypothetical protein EUX98_g5035 [Antrodiella citrinella]|uniref:Major facilitator superfamily (MFS) profile domain-containing protein n=1 Tax=Antrodiella citrinella TaxID=2447956 RepID=A0A4S4MSK8_9APHY|nr:hypothetical protein EUX98_g5035 [Antrodiella citrinella]
MEPGRGCRKYRYHQKPAFLHLMSLTQTSSLDIEAAKTVVDSKPDLHQEDPKLEQSEALPEPQATGPTAFRKAAILAILCSAQFFDVFNACASIAALPLIGADLEFTSGMLAWVLAAYTLTFGAFQVPAGRLSDIYHPKPVFVIGYLGVGIFSILCGVSVHPIMLLIFRAVSGIGAAMTIPSAIAMIVINFPDPVEQSRALGLYGAFGAVGNAIGFVLGGVLAAKASWRWVFHLIGICTVPFAVVAFFALPKTPVTTTGVKRSVDIPGITVLTAALILFVYAISDGGAEGWGTPQIITTLILSIVTFAAFFVVERYVKDPAIPPRIWFNKNFAVMFFFSWSVYWNLMAAELQLVQVFQDLWHWSPISAALHFLPFGASIIIHVPKAVRMLNDYHIYSGVVGGIITILTGTYGHLIPRRILLIAGQLCMCIGSILFALADTPDKYWSYIFPGMIVNMVGVALSYVGASVTTMSGAPKGEEGVVGAILYTSFQVGSTIGIAIVSSISFSVNQGLPLDALSQHKGYAASFWSVLGMHGVMIILSVLFVRD